MIKIVLPFYLYPFMRYSHWLRNNDKWFLHSFRISSPKSTPDYTILCWYYKIKLDQVWILPSLMSLSLTNDHCLNEQNTNNKFAKISFFQIVFWVQFKRNYLWHWKLFGVFYPYIQCFKLWLITITITSRIISDRQFQRKSYKI